ncbi:hypothetical protein [Arthrobacter sp. NA-172]|uniref:hypothetical protein n=1 Tax=Arthrobacter sp. NA-172 TaxID=3367524 RepID=UPI003754FC35
MSLGLDYLVDTELLPGGSRITLVLRKTAEAADVLFATRGIERKRKIGPGFTTLKHPWTAQDAAQRVDTLRQEVAALRRDEEGMSDPDYQRATEEIAGHMSQTWERIISQVLAECQSNLQQSLLHQTPIQLSVELP